MPMIDGSTPADAAPRITASGSSFSAFGPRLRHHDHRRGAVVDSRRVAGRHRAAVRLERRPQRRKAFDGGLRPRMLVALDDDRIALLRRQLDAEDLFVECTGVHRGAGLRLARRRELVLRLRARCRTFPRCSPR